MLYPRSLVLDAWCRMQDGGCRIHDAQCSMLDVRCLMLDAGCWMLDVWCLVLGAWCLVLGAWCLVLGAWCLRHDACLMLDAWCLILDTRCYMLIPFYANCGIVDTEDTIYNQADIRHQVVNVMADTLCIYWMTDNGWLILNSRSWIIDIWCKTQNAKYCIQDVGYQLIGSWYWIPDTGNMSVGYQILDTR